MSSSAKRLRRADLDERVQLAKIRRIEREEAARKQQEKEQELARRMTNKFAPFLFASVDKILESAADREKVNECVRFVLPGIQPNQDLAIFTIVSNHSPDLHEAFGGADPRAVADAFHKERVIFLQNFQAQYGGLLTGATFDATSGRFQLYFDWSVRPQSAKSLARERLAR